MRPRRSVRRGCRSNAVLRPLEGSPQTAPVIARNPFWKVPNVHAVVGAVGLALGLLPIRLSWWLARRDSRRRIDDVQRITALR